MIAFLKKLAVGLAAAYVTLIGIMYFGQRQLMYFPSNENPQPRDVGLSGVSVKLLTTPDGETLVTWYEPAAEAQPTILFFHGNAGEIGYRGNRFAAYRQAGFGVLFVSWRGYGGSTGTPSEKGILTDAISAYDWLIAQTVAPQMIVVVGESLGTGAAVQLASQKPVGAVLLGAPFSAAVEVAKDQYPFIPVGLLMKDQFRSVDHAAEITAPTLIIHGNEDRVVPYASGQKLFRSIAAPKEFITLEGLGHNAISDADAIAQEIVFIRRVFGFNAS